MPLPALAEKRGRLLSTRLETIPLIIMNNHVFQILLAAMKIIKYSAHVPMALAGLVEFVETTKVTLS
jgi:hypothetical protein